MNTQQLFSKYFFELRKFFRAFEDYKDNNIQAYLGTPQSAFRDNARKNGKTVLPMLNFHPISWTRKLDREPVNATYKIPSTLDKATGSIKVGRAPMVFEINYQISLWTNTYLERDDLLYKMYQQFYRNDFSFIVPITDEDGNDDYILMPFKVIDDFNDDTELEAGDPKETRDVIRTTWNMTGESLVPYYCCDTKVVKKIVTTGDELFEAVAYEININDEVSLEAC